MFAIAALLNLGIGLFTLSIDQPIGLANIVIAMLFAVAWVVEALGDDTETHELIKRSNKSMSAYSDAVIAALKARR